MTYEQKSRDHGVQVQAFEGAIVNIAGGALPHLPSDDIFAPQRALVQGFRQMTVLFFDHNHELTDYIDSAMIFALQGEKSPTGRDVEYFHSMEVESGMFDHRDNGNIRNAIKVVEEHGGAVETVVRSNDLSWALSVTVSARYKSACYAGCIITMVKHNIGQNYNTTYGMR